MLRILVISLFVANLLLLGFRGDQPTVQPEQKATRKVIENNNIPTIHLFSEMMEDQGLLSGSRQCFSLGPFHTVEDKDETLLRLQAISTRISERHTQALVEKGYWVFMSPYESLLEANQALFSLQALGLEDIGIIYDGEWKNAISLGYFMRQENAARRKKGLEDRGYAPLIRVQRKSEPRYWLDYEQTPGSGLVSLDMQNRPNDFMQRALPCPEEDLFDADAGESTLASAEVEPLQAAGTGGDLPPVEETDTNAQDFEVAEVESASAQITGVEDDLSSDQGVDSEILDSSTTAVDSEAGQVAEMDDGVQLNDGTNPNADDSTATADDITSEQNAETEEVLTPQQDAGEEAVESVEDLPENNVEAIPEDGSETKPAAGGGDGTGEG